MIIGPVLLIVLVAELLPVFIIAGHTCSSLEHLSLSFVEVHDRHEALAYLLASYQEFSHCCDFFSTISQLVVSSRDLSITILVMLSALTVSQNQWPQWCQRIAPGLGGSCRCDDSVKGCKVSVSSTG